MSHANPPLVPLVAEADFEAEVLRSPIPVLVDFATDWCAPCRALQRVLAEIAARRAGELRVVRVDAEASPALATRWAVRGFPTVVAIVGGTERARHVGLTSAERLLRLLD